MAVKCTPTSLAGMLLTAIAIKASSAFQQCHQIILPRRGSSVVSHYLYSRQRIKNTSYTHNSRAAASPSALHSSSFDDDFDDFDEFDNYDEFDSYNYDGWNDNGQQFRNPNQWDMSLENTQYPRPPPPPPYDRPPYSTSSSNLRNTIASPSTPSSPYDNPSWTKSSRYGNRNVNFNSRSNRNTNTFLRNTDRSTSNSREYDPYNRPTGYGRETYRNSSPKPQVEYNYQPSYKGYPMRTRYSQDDNYAGRRRWEDMNTSNNGRKKLYRDYDDVENDPNSSRGSTTSGGRVGGGESRFGNEYEFPQRPSQYRDYDDINTEPNRSYREDNNNRSNGLPPPPQYRDYDDVNMEPNRSYREDDSTMVDSGGYTKFPPRPSSRYRDYDDVNTQPNRSYRDGGGSRSNSADGRRNNNNNNNTKFPPRRTSNNNVGNKFPPRQPPPPPPRPQSIPNNFASPQSNRSDSPRTNFPPGVGTNMGYNPPSEYIPQNNRGSRASSSTWSNSFRENSSPPPPPPPPPNSNPNYSSPYNTFNDRIPSNGRDNNFRPRPNTNNNNGPPPPPKYQYDINRRQTYMDGGQTEYNFPNGDVIRKERLNTLRPTGFNSIFSDMFRPFQQMVQSAEQSLKSSDMLKEARLRVLDDEVVTTKLGEPLEFSPPFSQSSSVSSVNGRKASKVRARFQVGGPYGVGVATMDSVDGEIRSLVVDINGSTVRVGPRLNKGGGRKKKRNVVEAEILEEERERDGE